MLAGSDRYKVICNPENKKLIYQICNIFFLNCNVISPWGQKIANRLKRMAHVIDVGELMVIFIIIMDVNFATHVSSKRTMIQNVMGAKLLSLI
jgi:hypothetical protein